MSDIALYYPHVHPRDEAWLKHAVLYWPRIERIVPGGYLRTDTETMLALRQADILLERQPGAGSTRIAAMVTEFVSERAAELRGTYSLATAENLEPQPGWNDDHFDLRFGWIHQEKIDEQVVEALHDAGLAFVDHGEWIGMHPALSNVYMCALAAEMAEHGRNTPVTDEAIHHVAATGWTIDDLARALLPEADLAASAASRPAASEELVIALALRSVALRDMHSIPIERIIELRDKHGTEFRRFRQSIDALVASVAQLDVPDPQALAHHVELRYHDTVEADLQELRAALRKQRFDVVDSAVGLSAVPPAGIAATAVADVTTAGAATAAMTAFTVWKGRRARRAAAAATRAARPSAWLLRIEHELTPQGLAGSLGRLARRFAR